MLNRRKGDLEVRAIMRRELFDNLIAMAACLATGTLIGLFIGMSLRMHP